MIRRRLLLVDDDADLRQVLADQLQPYREFELVEAATAAAALERVRDALATRPDLKRYLAPSAGTFNWRKVAGAANMSVHSFGAAIDLNTKYADYWVWAGGKPGNVPSHANRYPMEIVAAFEAEGFIWGGRWYHYDTMHFEYRPELIAIAGAAGASACR